MFEFTDIPTEKGQTNSLTSTPQMMLGQTNQPQMPAQNTPMLGRDHINRFLVINFKAFIETIPFTNDAVMPLASKDFNAYPYPCRRS